MRASGSGAGCGGHWPLCNGEVIPQAPRIATLIEFSHRISSGLALIGVIVLLVWAFNVYPGGHRVRRGAVLSVVFMLSEALLGAGLVLFQYVAMNASAARAYWVAAHLVNTFLLLAALTLTAWWASGGQRPRFRNQGVLVWVFGIALASALVLGASGAITALGDTLLLRAGITPQASPLVARLVSLRIYHPILAFGVGLLLLIAAWTANTYRSGPATRRFSWMLGAFFVMQLIAGAINVALKAPIPVQLIHLFLSDLIWISLILLASSTLSREPVALSVAEGSPTQPSLHRPGVA